MQDAKGLLELPMLIRYDASINVHRDRCPCAVRHSEVNVQVAGRFKAQKLLFKKDCLAWREKTTEPATDHFSARVSQQIEPGLINVNQAPLCI
jgi:hypothetical protein